MFVYFMNEKSHKIAKVEQLTDKLLRYEEEKGLIVKYPFQIHAAATFILLIYIEKLRLRCTHNFKSDLINNMDHMRISGNELSSVILRQTLQFQKLKILIRKCQNKLKLKGMV